MKNITFIIITALFFILFSCQEELDTQEEIDYSILITKIDKQKIPEGTSMRVHFAAIDNDLNKLTFTTTDLPKGVKIFTHKNGTGYFEINAAEGSAGEYEISLFAENGGEKGKQDFALEILAKPEKALYLSPKSTDLTAKGTLEDPLPAFEKVAKADLDIEENTALILLDGNHGYVRTSLANVNIYAGINAHPVLDGIYYKGAKKIKMSGVEIRSTIIDSIKKEFMVWVDSLSTGIQISNCEVRTAKNTADWTQSKWDARAEGGIMVKGNDCLINNNLFENVFHALQTNADQTLVSYNIIDRFSGDAIRNRGSYNLYVNNCIKNAVVDDYSDKDGNHDDCFQSWTFDKPIRNITLTGNIAISCLEPNLPLKSRVVQGLACFDGFEEGWVVKNNLVVIDHPHGIALFGAKNCIVENNIILRNPYRLFDFESDPWIMVNPHKDGRPSIENNIKNNLCGALVLNDTLGIHESNVDIDGKYSAYLMDYEGWDFRVLGL